MKIEDVKLNKLGSVISGQFVTVVSTLSRRNDFCFSKKQIDEKKRIQGNRYEIVSIEFSEKRKKHAVAIKTGEQNGISWVSIENLTKC